MFPQSQARTPSRAGAVPRWLAVLAAISGAILSGAVLSACTGGTTPSDLFSSLTGPAQPPAQPASALGAGRVKVGLVLPLSGTGNAAVAAQSMRNAAEMALAEFNNPDLQLLVKDDAGTAPGAQQAAQQALDEGAEIILGPLFALSVGPVGQLARSRNVPVIAFSTDANVAARGVYLLSFLPESDVERIVGYAAGQGKKSFAALVPDNAYGTVVEGAFKQAVGRHNGRIVAFEHYPLDRAQMQGPARTVAQASSRADAIFIPDGADAVPTVVQSLISNGIDTKRVQLLGTGLWEDAQIFSTPALEGAWYAGPDSTGFRNFSARYRSRYGQDPVRTATLAYDAVALVAALIKTQGPKRFSEEVLTNPSGFTGIDGLFRFKPDGTSQRGLAVLRVSPSGGQVIAAPPKAFGASGI
jgi:ABC-type branched-subunit amino acid transport system substrate-binding protein